MESLSADRQEMVCTLMAVTGIEDVDFAREFLQDNGWLLEPSVNSKRCVVEHAPTSSAAVLASRAIQRSIGPL